MRFAKLTEFLDRRASHLSGGMQKKLALACTLIHTPEIILLDEPTTGVDPVSRREFWDILTELHLQGITLVISTPYMDEAERCARVGLLYRGRLVVCDAPANIRARAEGDLIALWSTDQRRARVLLDGLPGVLEVQIYGEQLRVFVDDASSMLDRVCTTLKEHGIEVHEAHETSPRMEDAFISLIRRQAMEGEAE